MKNMIFTFLALSVMCGTTVSAEQMLSERNVTQSHLAQANVKDISREFNQLFPGPYSLSDSDFETIKDKKFPRLTSNGEVLNSNAKVIAFAEKNKAFAAIFIKNEKDVIVISSNLKKSNNISVEGLKLDRDNTIYQMLSDGMGFHGKVTLWGKEYFAKLDPLKDKKGRVVGAFLVALPITSEAKLENK